MMRLSQDSARRPQEVQRTSNTLLSCLELIYAECAHMAARLSSVLTWTESAVVHV